MCTPAPSNPAMPQRCADRFSGAIAFNRLEQLLFPAGISYRQEATTLQSSILLDRTTLGLWGGGALVCGLAVLVLNIHPEIHMHTQTAPMG
jgi:hypothetical protein